MSGIADKLSAQNERLTAIKDELFILKELMDNTDETLTEEQMDSVQLLSEEQDSVIKRIEALEKIEQGLAAKAVPVQKTAATGGAFPREEKGGSLLAKAATVKLISHLEKKSEDQVLAERYKEDDRVSAIVKSTVHPANSYTSGWAAELVDQDTGAFLRDLEPISVYAALRARCVSLDFGRAESIKIPRRNAGDRGLQPAFVGEGGVIPVGQMTLGSQILNRYKVAVISAWTNELASMSTPQIEGLVREGILNDTAWKLDQALLDDAAAVNGVRPPGLLNGVTLVNSSGDTAADIIEDLKVLIDAMVASNLGANPVLIMNNSRLLGLSTVMNATGSFMFRDEVRSGTLLGVPVITSSNVPSDLVIIVDCNSLAIANSSPEFSVSDQTSLTMANADGTAPTQAGVATDYTGGDIGTDGEVPRKGGLIVAGDGSPTGASAAGYQALSMYQTYQTAIRMVLPTSWGLLRDGAVAGVDQVSW
jgi:HK97 family phage major capsid protein